MVSKYYIKYQKDIGLDGEIPFRLGCGQWIELTKLYYQLDLEMRFQNSWPRAAEISIFSWPQMEEHLEVDYKFKILSYWLVINKNETDVTAILNPTAGIKKGSLEMLNSSQLVESLETWRFSRWSEKSQIQLNSMVIRVKMPRDSGSDSFIPIRPHPLYRDPPEADY